MRPTSRTFSLTSLSLALGAVGGCRTEQLGAKTEYSSNQAKECALDATPFANSGNADGTRFGVEYSPTFFGATQPTRLAMWLAAHRSVGAGPRLRFDPYFDGQQTHNHCYVPVESRWENPSTHETCRRLGNASSPTGVYFLESNAINALSSVARRVNGTLAGSGSVSTVELWLNYLHEGGYLAFQQSKAEIRAKTGHEAISTGHFLGMDNFIEKSACPAGVLSFPDPTGGTYCVIPQARPFLQDLPVELQADALQSSTAQSVQAYNGAPQTRTVFLRGAHAEVQSVYLFGAVYGYHLKAFLDALGSSKQKYNSLPFEAKYYYHSLAYNRGAEVAAQALRSNGHSKPWTGKDNPGCAASLGGPEYNAKVRLGALRYMKMLCTDPSTRNSVHGGFCSELSGMNVAMPSSDDFARASAEGGSGSGSAAPSGNPAAAGGPLPPWEGPGQAAGAPAQPALPASSSGPTGPLGATAANGGWRFTLTCAQQRDGFVEGLERFGSTTCGSSGAGMVTSNNAGGIWCGEGGRSNWEIFLNCSKGNVVSVEVSPGWRGQWRVVGADWINGSYNERRVSALSNPRPSVQVEVK